MLSVNIYTPTEVEKKIAKNTKQRRLSQNMSRQTLSQHSGVSLGSIQRFEQKGKISLENLLKIAQALSALPEFHKLMELPEPNSILEMQRREKLPKRGRK